MSESGIIDERRFRIGLPIPDPETRKLPPEGAVVVDELGRRIGTISHYEGEGGPEQWVNIILDEDVRLSPGTDTIWFVRNEQTISYGFHATFEGLPQEHGDPNEFMNRGFYIRMYKDGQWRAVNIRDMTEYEFRQYISYRLGLASMKRQP